MSASGDRYGVLVTPKGSTRGKWLTGRQSLTSLRVHAASWNRDGAETIARDLVELNPDQVASAKAVAL